MPHSAEPEDNAATGRIEWIDSFRGIAITFVVAGHVLSDHAGWHYIYLFHMPLFFALSGYMFTRKDPRELTQRRIMSLLLPYAVYLVTLTIVDWALCAIDGREPSLPPFPLPIFLLRAVYGGSLLHEALGILWFLTALFMTNIAFALAAWRYGSANSKPMVAMAFGSLLLAYVMPPLRAPLAAAQVPFAYFFFWAGAFYRQRPSEPRWMWVLVVAVATPSFLAAPDLDMKYMEFGVPWLNVPAALGASYLLLRLARFLSKVPVWRRCSSEIGQASMVIFTAHFLIRQHLIGLMAEWLVILVCMLVPYLLYRAMMLTRATRVLFLGRGKPPIFLRHFFERRFPHHDDASSSSTMPRSSTEGGGIR